MDLNQTINLGGRAQHFEPLYPIGVYLFPGEEVSYPLILLNKILY